VSFFFLGVLKEEFSSFSFFSLLVTIVKKKVLEFHFLLEALKFLNIYIYIVPHEKYFSSFACCHKRKKSSRPPCCNKEEKGSL
jgi:hypothetical protein